MQYAERLGKMVTVVSNVVQLVNLGHTKHCGEDITLLDKMESYGAYCCTPSPTVQLRQSSAQV
jgi:hypothetical protein